MEVIKSEQRFWDACACAPTVIAYALDLLGASVSSWKFARAIVRVGHVSTLFIRPSEADTTELWISATLQPNGQWTLRHSELPERSRA